MPALFIPYITILHLLVCEPLNSVIGKKYFKINVLNEESNLENFAWHLFKF